MPWSLEVKGQKLLKGEGLETSIIFKAYSFILYECLCIHASKQPMFKCSMSSHLSHEVLSVLCTQGQLSKYNVTINNNPGNTFLYRRFHHSKHWGSA